MILLATFAVSTDQDQVTELDNVVGCSLQCSRFNRLEIVCKHTNFAAH